MNNFLNELLHWEGTCLSVGTVPLRMLSKLCCGLGNLLGLIVRERSNKESEPLHAIADLEGQETLGTRYCTMFTIMIMGKYIASTSYL